MLPVDSDISFLLFLFSHLDFLTALGLGFSAQTCLCYTSLLEGSVHCRKVENRSRTLFGCMQGACL